MNNDIRKMGRKKLYDYISEKEYQFVDEELNKEFNEIVKQYPNKNIYNLISIYIEQGMFENTCIKVNNTLDKMNINEDQQILFNNHYNNLIIQFIENLNYPDLPLYLVKCNKGQFHDLANFTPYELNPSITKEIHELIKFRTNQKTEEKESNKYTCRKCKATRTKYYEYVTNGDEATKTIITCLSCGKWWKQ